MKDINILVSCVIGLALLNVWIVRFNKATNWRGGAAKNMKEEFAAYGLPIPVMIVVGAIKVSIAIALIASLWFPDLIRPACGILSLLMLCAVAMHVKVKDPIKKSLPALTLFLLTAFNVGYAG